MVVPKHKTIRREMKPRLIGGDCLLLSLVFCRCKQSGWIVLMSLSLKMG